MAYDMQPESSSLSKVPSFNLVLIGCILLKSHQSFCLEVLVVNSHDHRSEED